ncbi:MAG: UDP-N-acetylmuramoyl-tripeptide--D-alanyl-D-alanine ligase [Eubacteriales bacterium]
MITTSIWVGMNLIVAILVVRYHLHMFQLNSYKHRESLVWIQKHFLELVGKMITILISVVIYMVKIPYASEVSIVLMVVAILINLPQKAKLSLHYTMRVKRLIITIVIMYIISHVVIYSVRKEWWQLIMMCWLLVVPYLVLFGNLCNRPMEKAIARYYVNDARKVINDMNQLVVIGVTGSYGKTSMKYLLKELLSIQYNTLCTPGNFNTTLGVVRTIREHLKPTHQVFVCEMGAKNIGDIKEICDLVHPKYGVITSIGPQHLESFGTIENVIETKFELIDSLPSEGVAVLNYDNAYIRNKSVTLKKYSYGITEEQVTTRAYGISLSEKGSTFYITGEDGVEVEFQTSLIGQHNVLNIVGAITMAHELGIPLQAMKQKVKRLKPVPHRMELRKHDQITIIDDAYNSNPMGARMALETLGMFDGMRILVTPGMIELGVQEYELNKQLGEQATQVADYIVLVGEKQTKPIYDGIVHTQYDMNQVYVASDFQSAINHVYGIPSEKHKIVLLENDLPDNYN